MQYINHADKNIHKIFDDIEQFYSLVSVKSKVDSVIPYEFDNSFTDLYQLFCDFVGNYWNFRFIDKQYNKLNLPKFESKNIILCFTGGKDSIAAAKHYLKLGYNVYLYYLKNVNTTMHDEWIQAGKLAEKLGLPIYFDEITRKGHNDYIEHPMKNIIIVNRALQYGIRNNISTKIAIGNYYTSSVYRDNFEFCGGDDMETWIAYENIIKTIIPNFRIYVCLKNLNSTLKSVCSDRELLDLSVSCLSRASMRKYWHTWVEDKFGVILPEHRCGRCYKCCVEYIYMVDHNLQEYNKAYYDYCFTNLKKNLCKEGVDVKSINDVFNSYFMYNIEHSKLLTN